MPPLDPRTDFRDDGASFRVRRERALASGRVIDVPARGLRARLRRLTFPQMLALVILGPILLLVGFTVGLVAVGVAAGI